MITSLAFESRCETSGQDTWPEDLVAGSIWLGMIIPDVFFVKLSIVTPEYLVLIYKNRTSVNYA